MKLRVRNMEAENDKVAEQEYLDLIDITADENDEEGNPLFQWVQHIYLFFSSTYIFYTKIAIIS